MAGTSTGPYRPCHPWLVFSQVRYYCWARALVRALATFE